MHVIRADQGRRLQVLGDAVTIKVSSAQSPFGQAIVRQLCHMLNFTIGYLLIFGAERKAVHDMITKTVVIKVDR